MEHPATTASPRRPDSSPTDAADLIKTATHRVAELDQTPVAEHVAVYDDLHDRLHQVLTGHPPSTG